MSDAFLDGLFEFLGVVAAMVLGVVVLVILWMLAVFSVFVTVLNWKRWKEPSCDDDYSAD